MRNGKVGIGVIGTGGIARDAHLPGYARIPDQCEVIAVADINEEAARTIADRFGVPHVFTDFRHLLAMPEIDAVSVCTPNYAHKEPAILGLEAGKHVLCEKPIAMNAAEAREMVDAARRTGRKLQIGYNLRFDPKHQLLKKYVDAGDLGDIYYARAQALRRRGIPGWGVFVNKKLQGGGPLIDIGVHILDLTLWLMGHPKPVSASGITYAKFGHRDDIVGFLGQWNCKEFSVEDFAAALIRLENGATIVLESSFVANIPEDLFTTTLCGTEGGAVSSPLTIMREQHRSLQKFAPEIPATPNLSTHAEEVKDFVRCIIEDRQPLVTCEHGLMVAQVMDAIYASSEQGREVAIG